MTARLRVLVVDDEPHARAGIIALLRKHPRFEVAGECGDGPGAVAAIRDRRPDLVLLDVQMPGMDGFGVIGAVGAAAMPAVVFVTAFDRYAVQAFEAAAIDYVRKPFSDARLLQALDRAAAAHRAAGYRELVERLLAAVAPGKPPGAPVTFLVRSGVRSLQVRADDIDWIEAADYQARMHVGGKVYFVRESMAALERRLDSGGFVRTHRSAIVAVDRIASLERRRAGNHVAVLTSGARVPVGRQRWRAVEEALRTRRG